MHRSNNLCYFAVLANRVFYSKTPDESSFKEEGLTLTHGSGVQFILAGKQGLAALDHIVSAARRQRVMNACCQLLLLSLFNLVWAPSPCGMAQPRMKVGLSTSSNLVHLSEMKLLSLETGWEKQVGSALGFFVYCSPVRYRPALCTLGAALDTGSHTSPG